MVIGYCCTETCVMFVVAELHTVHLITTRCVITTLKQRVGSLPCQELRRDPAATLHASWFKKGGIVFA